MDKKIKKVRAHAKKHGMSYQASHNLLEGGDSIGGLLQALKDGDHAGFLKKLDALEWNSFERMRGPVVMAPLSLEILADLYCELEEGRHPPVAFQLSSRRYSDIRKFGREVAVLFEDPGLIRSGMMGMLWGAYMLMTDVCDSKLELIGVSDARTVRVLEVQVQLS